MNSSFILSFNLSKSSPSIILSICICLSFISLNLVISSVSKLTSIPLVFYYFIFFFPPIYYNF
ncbi:hypothetical protein C1645_789825 [Glomus cerebriforme]|uniref:Uncharacterized protein n=1 Tax=Glomus cerebriforme TaxID=658196 RepID=A0A397SBN5_9GLOM|nr:hypothetical protein C1645_789825 [Glomus cerebriforme]